MRKDELEQVLDKMLVSGGDFAEVYEDKITNVIYVLTDSKIDDIKTLNSKGVGLRLAKGEDMVYASSDNPTFDEVIEMAEKLSKSYNEERQIDRVKLEEVETKEVNKVLIPYDKYPIAKKIELLKKMDKLVRAKSDKVVQVEGALNEATQEVVVSNSSGKLVKDCRTNFRLQLSITLEENGKKVRKYNLKGKNCGYELLDEVDIEEFVEETYQDAVAKLKAESFEGGKLPVVLGNGFGAVIFHEACGHGLEAASVAPKVSVFADKLGKKVASSKVTLIDDGTIPGLWGTNKIDDEGSFPQENVLIDQGILKNYLVDELSSRKMHCEANGCSRRESHNYAPTARMSNTYLKPGHDKIEDMIKSIDYGVYAKYMSGGSVNTSTGDFNFEVDVAYLIENGKITKPLEGVSLIGNSLDILNNVEMVSDDLKYSDGYCGAASGMIHVTIGQPTIKVSEILVGGRK